MKWKQIMYDEAVEWSILMFVQISLNVLLADFDSFSMWQMLP